jgi:hypothetical protein
MTEIRRWLDSVSDYVNWDRVGIFLSSLCALHCILTPFVILSIPMMARYYLANPYFHLAMAILILPVGSWAFILGFRHHHNKRVLFLGIPGLLIISIAPMLIHQFNFRLNEIALMVTGSGLLITAHWINKRSCAHCAAHKAEGVQKIPS